MPSGRIITQVSDFQPDRAIWIIVSKIRVVMKSTLPVENLRVRSRRTVMIGLPTEKAHSERRRGK